MVGAVSALAGLLGAGVGLGLVLAWAGWRGVALPRPARSPAQPKVERATLRLGLAAGAAVVVGAATGWPVGALLAGLAGWGLPALLAGTKGRAEALAHIEAVAGWAEMLRDTMAGAAGLEQAIVATAAVA
ncbi:MAG: pilus assembly protein TadB, partial [Actinomycetota bacterium]|nr:pilus assembly protein TadB [Actinomycetota bacterium]